MGLPRRAFPALADTTKYEANVIPDAERVCDGIFYIDRMEAATKLNRMENRHAAHFTTILREWHWHAGADGPWNRAGKTTDR